MMQLTTRVLSSSDDHVFIGWKTGVKKFGVVAIEHLLAATHRLEAAELVAIRHLLFTKRVFNRHPFTGVGYALDVDAPSLSRPGRCRDIEELADLSRFFLTNLRGVTINRSGEAGLIGIPQQLDEAQRVDALTPVDFDVIETEALGRIRITAHAIERYDEWHHAGKVNAPVYSLLTRLKHPGLTRQAMPTRAEQHKIRRYGTIENVEVWGHASSQLHFVVIRDKPTGIGTVVTVFRRHPSYMEPTPLAALP